MTLIKSISGIRGTIGGPAGDGLTPLDIVKFTSAFCQLIQKRKGKRDILVVVGRDARISGAMVQGLVNNTLSGMGAHVIDLGLSTTPTVEIAVPLEKADAGIILTASHNPKQWNALKLLNHKGEFISAEDGQEMLAMADAEDFSYADVDQLGTIISKDYLFKHIEEILKLELVNKEAIEKANFNIAVDAVNSTGGIYVPALLEALGVKQIHKLYCEPNGHFPHNPEPLPEHLTDISSLVKEKGCDFGIVVDPDVDRLAFVNEDGSMFGEEYTLVAVADYVLSKTPGNTVSNLSSTRALRDVTEQHKGSYTAAAVGEVNVVIKMKETNAVIGGEGNGGIIYPEAHYGRDALVGIALFLSHLAEKKMKMTELRASYPAYVISKNKIELTPAHDVDAILRDVQGLFPDAVINTIDGVKFDFPDGWVHLRKSNTEPIVRVYAEHSTTEQADALAQKVINAVKQIVHI
ncbi:MAG TPA: phosphoglucosamine mutase [Flavobacteriales bacterium]